MDFFPTVLDLAGLPTMPEKHVDGTTLMPLLKGESDSRDRQLVWHYPHYHGSTWTPGAAIREREWKLIEFYEFDEVELYNLKNDGGEQTDLSESHPEKTADLRAKLRNWQSRMGAQMPQPNAKYDPHATHPGRVRRNNR